MNSNLVPVMSSETASQMMTDTVSYQQSRRLELLFQNLVVAGGLGGVGNLVVAALLYWHIPSTQLMVWAVSSFCVAALQLAAHLAYLKRRDSLHARQWIRIHELISVFSGLNQTYLAMAVFPAGDTYTHMIVAITIAGLIAGAVTVNAASMRSFLLFAYPPCVALMVSLLLTSVPIAQCIAVLVGLFLLGMTKSIREISEVINQNLELSEALHKSATQDTLVGLANRREFMRRLEGTSIGARSSDEGTALIFIDLDNFKALNDSQGHPAGDRALERVGQALRGRIRQSDVAARLGGDEFVILLHPASAQGARTVATNVLAGIRALDIQVSDAQRLTASIGIGYCPGGRFDPESLMVCADTACYEAKRSGRDQIRYACHARETPSDAMFMV